MTSVSTAQTQQVAFKKIPQTALIAAAIGVVGNVLVWFIGNTVSTLTLPIAPVIISSIIAVIMGTILFAILAKFTKRPVAIFIIISIVFLLLSVFGPINQMNPQPAGSPAPQFNMATMIAAQIMHVISGVGAIWAFNKYPRA